MDTTLMQTTKGETQEIRKCLHQLRQRWDEHSPAKPFCLIDTLHGDITVSQFCINHMMQHRGRKVVEESVETKDHDAPSLPKNRELLD